MTSLFVERPCVRCLELDRIIDLLQADLLHERLITASLMEVETSSIIPSPEEPFKPVNRRQSTLSQLKRRALATIEKRVV